MNITTEFRYMSSYKSSRPFQNRLRICLLSVVITMCQLVPSQTFTADNNYLITPSLVNPATVGASYVPKLSLLYNRQWTNIENAPTTISAIGEIRLGKFDFYNPKMLLNKTKFKSLERVGIGTGICSDMNGPYREMNFLFTYSYHLPLSDLSTLSFGLTGIINNYSVNSSMIQARHPDDPLINFENATNGNVNSGIYYYHPKFNLGVSLLDILTPNSNTPLNDFPQQKLCLLGAYRFNVVPNKAIIEPSLLFRHNFKEGSDKADISARFFVLNVGWMAYTLKEFTQSNITVTLRVFKNWYVGYKFAGTSSEIQYYTHNSHGIALGINLGVDQNTSLYIYD